MVSMDISFLNKFPEFLTSSDLVELGIFSSINQVYQSRRRGYSPRFMKVGRKVLYPKSCLVDYIRGLMEGKE